MQIICRYVVTILLVFCAARYTWSAEPETLRVMSFNLWHGGDEGKQPVEQSAKVIREAKADIIGLQETAGHAPQGKPRPDNAEKLAQLLGWHYQKQATGLFGSNIGIISRYPIAGTVGEKPLGVVVRLPSQREVTVFNVHLMHAPYQPYQLLKIPYGNAPYLDTAEQAIDAANKARQKQVTALLEVIQLAKTPITVVTGDFNEPSALDWTKETVAAKRHPLPVEWPTSKAMQAVGFRDTFREFYPDPMKHPGFTWTLITKSDDPKDHHDRIDFVLVRGPAKVSKVAVVGESAERADIVVTPYPSDHRGVMATLVIDP
jgi:exodeoxyribonuclease III